MIPPSRMISCAWIMDERFRERAAVLRIERLGGVSVKEGKSTLTSH